MSFEEIRKIQLLLKQIKELRELMRAFGSRNKTEKQEITVTWLNEHSSELGQLPGEQLDGLREAAEYDEVEWAMLLQKLKEPERDDRQGQ